MVTDNHCNKLVDQFADLKEKIAGLMAKAKVYSGIGEKQVERGEEKRGYRNIEKAKALLREAVKIESGEAEIVKELTKKGCMFKGG